MKKSILVALLGAGLVLGASKAEAQHFYVSIQPKAHVVKRPPAPSSNHVWVSSEWSYSGGKYVEKPGYWAVPPRGHKSWTAGHWEKEKRGNYWVGGHWN
jgi:hypothetical protein